jgi:phosphatidylglycerophosphatase A
VNEALGQPIAFMALPPSMGVFIGGFSLFRFFDILKPFPAGGSQRLRSGLGVMADDVFAGAYANPVLGAVLALL